MSGRALRDQLRAIAPAAGDIAATALVPVDADDQAREQVEQFVARQPESFRARAAVIDPLARERLIEKQPARPQCRGKCEDTARGPENDRHRPRQTDRETAAP